MKIKNQIPNLITITRIILSVLLLFITPLSADFFILYLICGASDAIDGAIARKAKLCSQLGAVLDSIADTVFIAIVLIILIPLLHWSLWILFWMGTIAFTRLLSLAIGFLKYHTITFLHTFANKVTGFVLFCSPILYGKLGFTAAAIFVCSLASISAVEELGINIISNKLDRDIRSILIN